MSPGAIAEAVALLTASSQTLCVKPRVWRRVPALLGGGDSALICKMITLCHPESLQTQPFSKEGSSRSGQKGCFQPCPLPPLRLHPFIGGGGGRPNSGPTSHSSWERVFPDPPPLPPSPQTHAVHSGRSKGPKLTQTTQLKARRFSRTGRGLSECVLANSTPSSQRLSPPPPGCLLPLPPLVLGDKIGGAPPSTGNGRLSPALLPLPTTQLEGGGEVSRVHKGQMLRRKRTGPTPHPPPHPHPGP